MKTTILLITLISGSIGSAFGQINLKRKTQRPADNLSGFHYDIKPAFGFGKRIEPKGVWDGKTVEGLFSNGTQHTNGEQEKAFVRYSMPCYKPEGIFSMRIVTPDTTVRYTMPIKK